MTYPDDYKVNIEDYPKDEKGRHIVPDEIMNLFYQQLPSGTLNESKTYQAYNGGRLHLLGADQEWTKEITSAGGKAVQAVCRQRRSLQEDIKAILGKPADKQTLATAGLESGTYQDAIIASMLREASKGTVRAFEALRDTAGEAPVKQTEVTATVTEGDKELLRKVQQRLGLSDS